MAEAPAYLSVRNWDEFQQYKDRRPAWIKLHTSLTDDYEFCRLTDAAKFHVVGIFLLAARMENKIPNDPNWVARKIEATTEVDLSQIIAAGFLVAWKPGDSGDRTGSVQTLYEPRTLEEKSREEENREEKNNLVELKTAINEVYDHWREKCGKADPRYDKIAAARAQKIRARLSDGFPVADLKRAIDAVAADPWPERKKHNDITVIFRSREKVDEWLDRATEAATSAGRFDVYTRA